MTTASRDDRIRLHKQMVAAADTPRGKKMLNTDVEKFAYPIATISENFKIIDAKWTTMQYLGATEDSEYWKVLHAEYDSIFISIKELTSEIVAYSIQFDEAVLAIVVDHTIPLEDRRGELQDSISQAMKNSASSQEIANRLEMLSNQLFAFKNRITHFSEKEKGELKKEIAHASDKIAQMNSVMLSSNKEMETLISSSTHDVESIAGIKQSVIPSFSNFLWASGSDGTSDPFSKLDSLVKQRNDIGQELRTQKAHKANLEGRLAAIATVRAVVQEVPGRVDSIGEGIINARGLLNYCDSVSNGIKGRCNEIISYLNAGSAGNQPVDPPDIVEVYLAMQKTLFSALAEPLKLTVLDVSKVRK